MPRPRNGSGLFCVWWRTFNQVALCCLPHLIAALCLASLSSSLRFAQLRNRGTSVALRFTWCGNVDALHSRLELLRLWRAGSERTPESSPHLSRVGASAPLGPSGATSRVMSAVKFIRLNGKPFFSNACPPPCHVPSASQTQCGIKPLRVVPLGPTCYLYALNLCPFALWGAASVVRSLVDVGRGAR
jgi:hypothetical protein